ncbi:hypothetical protein AYO38_10960 [bacterium SCGC AG-212-C10]|nr:hypothetical protein AYO38_10960 [bacterium SCGC AG-212-C10]
MAEHPTETSEAPVPLGEALREFMDSLKPELKAAHGGYVRKYVEYAGEQTLTNAISSSKVESFAETQIKASDPAAPERVAALKSWFVFLKKKSYVSQNYGVNIRVRRTGGRAGGSNQVRLEQKPVEMTAEGIAAMRAELEDLTAKVPEIVMEITRAREDKDFRENAPLDAAREALAFNEQRRKQIESTLKHAVVVDRTGEDRSAVGSVITVTRLDSGVQQTYTLVGPREANAREMKISVESPVGRELLGRVAGDEVAVSVPSGVIEYRVESVAHA